MEVPSLLNRLSSMIERRYGCAMSFSPIELLAKSSKDETLALVRRNRGAEMIISKSDLVLPMEVESQLLGVTTILGGAKLLPSDMEQVRQLVDLILGSYLIGQAKLQSLMELEQHLRWQLQRSDAEKLGSLENQGVTFLHEEVDRDEHSGISERVSETLLFSDLRPEAHSALLIEGDEQLGLSEMALEIHRLSGRSAFVRFFDFDKSERTNLEAMKSLGPITMYVDNPSALSGEEKRFLELCLDLHNGNSQFPRVIIGLTGSSEEAVERGDLSEKIHRALKMSRVRLGSGRQESIEAPSAQTVAKLIFLHPRSKELN